MNMETLLNKKFAFTLVELLVVISIIATLVAILLPNFMGTRERARDSQKIQDGYAIKNALRMYYNDEQTYPVDLAASLNSYMPSISGIDLDNYQYSLTNDGDGFLILIQLESGQGDEDINSQSKCGIDAASQTEGVYAVCAS